jgi:hypothetical protein
MSRVVSVDLGQLADYTAVTIIERLDRLNPDYDGVEAQMSLERRKRRIRGFDYLVPRDLPPLFNVTYLRRFELGTPYPEIVAQVKRLMDSPKLQDQPLSLALDATGVGVPVRDMFKKEMPQARILPVLIHGGDNELFGKGFYRVPKRELISRAVKLLQRRELNVAPSLEYAQTLIEELRAFRLKININTGHDSYEAWRERDHDDLVLSLCIGLWASETKGSGQVFSIAKVLR